MHYRWMGKANNNLLMNVGLWDVLLPPCYSIITGLAYHKLIPENWVTVFKNVARECCTPGFPRKESRLSDWESNPACWGAVCAGAVWSLSPLAPPQLRLEQEKNKLTTALVAISSRVITSKILGSKDLHYPLISRVYYCTSSARNDSYIYVFRDKTYLFHAGHLHILVIL